MDILGKDSLIWEVFKEFNLCGMVVYSFKILNLIELEYDYLWCYYIVLLEKGKFVIFNCIYYENVLVICVYFEYIMVENLSGINLVDDIMLKFWKNRIE